MANFNLRKFFHIANGILLILINWMILAHSKRLPEIIPIHFSIDGTPDNWSGKKSFLNEMIIVVWALNAFLYLIIFLIPWFRKHPALISIPHKEIFLKLPPEKQQVLWNLLVEFLAALLTAVNILFLTGLLGTIQVALGSVEKLSWWTVWPGLTLTFVLSIIYIPRLVRTPKKLIKSSSPGPHEQCM